ncbi:MAG: histidinol-phosphatase [Desulfovibrionaceae bacterium]|nr:histidinol-phosphatase [Desulfovibrionaceae bacterium]
MITIDLHTHTFYSHGKHSPQDMFAAAMKRGISLYGFSEHSPRPLGYDYPQEYREHLAAHMDDYARDVLSLQERHPGKVLFGLEMDWLDEEREFIAQSIAAYPYDYLLGSVHFIGNWGLDVTPLEWEQLDEAQCAARYERYFQSEINMAKSGMFNIAAHLDLVKIFSVEPFHRWLHAGGMDLVREALLAIRDAGMALEISSAGLRKVCREIYPCPPIMRMAAELGLPVTFASDAHATQDVAAGFPQLESYARAFGYEESVWFQQGQMHAQRF